MRTELLEQAIDDALKARVVLRRERALNPLVRRAEAAMGRMFRRQGRTLLRELAKRRQVFTESAEDDAIMAAFDAAANDPEMMAWLETYGSAAFAEAMMATGTFLALDAAFELPFPEATTYARRRSAELVRGLDATTRESLRTMVATATEKGWSYNRLAAEIRLKFDGFAGKMPQQHIQTRAHMVAVTELGQAYEEGNAAAAKAVQAVGIALEKAWLTVGDDRVDPSCSANEGAGWIPLDDPFPSGVMHPLDHPGCRCAGLTRRAEDKP